MPPCASLQRLGQNNGPLDTNQGAIRTVSSADCMEATGLTARERVASALPSDTCALVTGGQSCTPLDLMLI